jgi:hypothetical protein
MRPPSASSDDTVRSSLPSESINIDARNCHGITIQIHGHEQVIFVPADGTVFQFGAYIQTKLRHHAVRDMALKQNEKELKPETNIHFIDSDKPVIVS